MNFIRAKFQKFYKNHFSYDVNYDERLCYLMCLWAIIANIVNLISTISLRLPLVCDILAVLCLFIMLILSGIAYSTHKTYVVSILLTIIISNIFFPFMFLTEGGIDGGMPFYFELSSVCIAFTIRKKYKYPIIIFSLIEYTALFYIAYTYPEIIIPIPEKSRLFDIIFGCITVFTFLYLFTSQAVIHSERDRKKINQISQMYRHQANTDELTGLFNRRYFKDAFGKILEENNSNENYISDTYIAMFDIDNFKVINDTYGHPFGDEVLKQFSEILFEENENGALSCRYGGEEFILVIRDANKVKALMKTSDILYKTRSKITCGIERKPVTVSAGLVCCEKNTSYESIIENVDANLYKAKNTGKNKVVCDFK